MSLLPRNVIVEMKEDFLRPPERIFHQIFIQRHDNMSPPLHGLMKSVLLLGTLPPPYEEGRASLPKRWGSTSSQRQAADTCCWQPQAGIQAPDVRSHCCSLVTRSPLFLPPLSALQPGPSPAWPYSPPDPGMSRPGPRLPAQPVELWRPHQLGRGARPLPRAHYGFSIRCCCCCLGPSQVWLRRWMCVLLVGRAPCWCRASSSGTSRQPLSSPPTPCAPPGLCATWARAATSSA
nr:PREDICTED: LOW QUALITY PROTEIN: uncharacterized protein LOC105062796 [Camelus bactrianus]